jgi:hypothetical protein
MQMRMRMRMTTKKKEKCNNKGVLTPPFNPLAFYLVRRGDIVAFCISLLSPFVQYSSFYSYYFVLLLIQTTFQTKDEMKPVYVIITIVVILFVLGLILACICNSSVPIQDMEERKKLRNLYNNNNHNNNINNNNNGNNSTKENDILIVGASASSTQKNLFKNHYMFTFRNKSNNQYLSMSFPSNKPDGELITVPDYRVLDKSQMMPSIWVLINKDEQTWITLFTYLKERIKDIPADGFVMCPLTEYGSYLKTLTKGQPYLSAQEDNYTADAHKGTVDIFPNIIPLLNLGYYLYPVLPWSVIWKYELVNEEEQTYMIQNVKNSLYLSWDETDNKVIFVDSKSGTHAKMQWKISGLGFEQLENTINSAQEGSA